MSAKEIIGKLAEKPKSQIVEIGGGQIEIRRVTPTVAINAAAKAKDEGDAWLAELVAYSIADGDERPLASPEGAEQIAALPPGDFLALAQAAMLVNGLDRGN